MMDKQIAPISRSIKHQNKSPLRNALFPAVASSVKVWKGKSSILIARLEMRESNSDWPSTLQLNASVMIGPCGFFGFGIA